MSTRERISAAVAEANARRTESKVNRALDLIELEAKRKRARQAEADEWIQRVKERKNIAR